MSGIAGFRCTVDFVDGAFCRWGTSHDMAMQTPGIPRTSTAVIFNDMINSNLRTGNVEHDRAIDESGIIPASVALVNAAREAGLPIYWIRVERRADRTDVFDTLTDDFIAAGMVPKPPVTRGATKAANIDELPVHDEDQVILKPRFDPFIGTDLDLRLRTNGIDTILLGGYSTNIGVESCARTAKDRNYNVVLLSDCSFNVDVASHEWTLAKIMPTFARVMTSSEALGLLA
jgi:nicotinamidase-related amidase